MSELRSVIAFFLGLVFFVVIIGLALGRIRLPGQNQTKTITEQITPTAIPTPSPTKKPGLIEKIAGIFKKTTPTPTLIPTRKPNQDVIEVAQVQETGTPVTEMKQALDPETNIGQVSTSKGGQVISIDRFPQENQTVQTKGGQTIPESGAPTLLIPLAMMIGGFGKFLSRQK